MLFLLRSATPPPFDPIDLFDTWFERKSRSRGVSLWVHLERESSTMKVSIITESIATPPVEELVIEAKPATSFSNEQLKFGALDPRESEKQGNLIVS